MACRILLADDNPMVRAAVRKLFSGNSEEWDIHEATDGRDAITRAVELRPDAIILDLAMPAIDGLTAAREISKVLPQAPIVLYTMHWSHQLEMEAAAFGVRKVLAKTDGGLLPEIIRQLLAPAEETAPVAAIPIPIQEPEAQAPQVAPVVPMDKVVPLEPLDQTPGPASPEDPQDFPQRRCS